MRALIIDSYGDPATVLRVGEVDKPVLKRGQVLVKVAAAPIHPADIAFVNGFYGIRRPPPTVPGLEGGGVVVESNAGLYGRWLVGKRVACTATSEGTGTWAEYVACDAAFCAPLPAEVTAAQSSMMLVNPLTACSFVSIAKGRNFVQTAAASALGRMVARLAARRGLSVINVVRRQEQVDALRAEGAAHVLSSTDPDFDAMLKERVHQLDAKLAFDAIGGETSARIVAALPKGGRVVVYGGLSGEDARISLPDVIFNGKGIDGYWVPLHMAKTGRLEALRMIGTIRRHATTIFASKVIEQLPLERFADALVLQRERASEGKVLLVP
jgi:NADPH2:quinone reductase